MRKHPVLAALLAGTALAVPAHADMTRLATIPVGAEITGLHLTENGDFFMNIQHPATAITGPYNKATVGYFGDADFAALPDTVEALPAADSQSAKQTVRTTMGEYRILMQQGDFSDVVEGGVGAIVSKDGTVLKVSNDPDFNGFIPTGENEGYLFTNWEDRPGGMSRVKLVRDEAGKWIVGMAKGPNGSDDEAEVVDVQMVDFSGVGGTWVNCFGSVSPWNTPLTSEELYFDNTESWNDPEAGEDFDDAEMTRRYAGGLTNPYDYGYIVEITDPAREPSPVKRFAMGRYSHENSYVMPDEKTVYLSDDGTGTVFFKFVADTAGDLSAGTLHAAKATQRTEPGSDAASTGFDIEWVELAHGDEGQIAEWIETYAGIEEKGTGDKRTDFISDDQIQAWADGEAEDDRVAFLESRKAAAAKGATAEFRKMEGVRGNAEAIESGTAPYIYMAMSEIGETMADEEGDIQVAENLCGAVYRMEFDDRYSITSMVPAVAGGPYDESAAGDACATDAVANPDNLVVLPDGRVVVGEDSGFHENNTLWLYTAPQS